MELVFDGHNDVLLRLWRNAAAGGDPIAEMVNGTTAGHIDLPRAKADYNRSRSLSRSPRLEKENDYENENDSALAHRSL